MDDIYKKIDPIVVDLSLKEEKDICVVRVMSEHLIPFHFGYGAEHSIRKRFNMLKLDWRGKYPSLIHMIA